MSRNLKISFICTHLSFAYYIIYLLW